MIAQICLLSDITQWIYFLLLLFICGTRLKELNCIYLAFVLLSLWQLLQTQHSLLEVLIKFRQLNTRVWVLKYGNIKIKFDIRLSCCVKERLSDYLMAEILFDVRFDEISDVFQSIMKRGRNIIKQFFAIRRLFLLFYRLRLLGLV